MNQRNTNLHHCARYRDVNKKSSDCGCSSSYTHEVRCDNCDDMNRGCGCTNARNPYSTQRIHSHTNSSRQKNGCNPDNGHLAKDAPIAMVYSPMQQWKELYDPLTGLSQGTIFKELDLPFYPTPCYEKEKRSCHCQ